LAGIRRWNHELLRMARRGSWPAKLRLFGSLLPGWVGTSWGELWRVCALLPSRIGGNILVHLDWSGLLFHHGLRLGRRRPWPHTFVYGQLLMPNLRARLWFVNTRTPPRHKNERAVFAGQRDRRKWPVSKTWRTIVRTLIDSENGVSDRGKGSWGPVLSRKGLNRPHDQSGGKPNLIDPQGRD
jgi:hypothetical protein